MKFNEDSRVKIPTILQFNNTFKLEVSKNEAYRMIFGVEYSEDDFYKRPFSKFKMDILSKLGIKF